MDRVFEDTNNFLLTLSSIVTDHRGHPIPPKLLRSFPLGLVYHCSCLINIFLHSVRSIAVQIPGGFQAASWKIPSVPSCLALLPRGVGVHFLEFERDWRRPQPTYLVIDTLDKLIMIRPSLQLIREISHPRLASFHATRLAKWGATRECFRAPTGTIRTALPLELTEPVSRRFIERAMRTAEGADIDVLPVTTAISQMAEILYGTKIKYLPSSVFQASMYEGMMLQLPICYPSPLFANALHPIAMDGSADMAHPPADSTDSEQDSGLDEDESSEDQELDEPEAMVVSVEPLPADEQGIVAVVPAEPPHVDIAGQGSSSSDEQSPAPPSDDGGSTSSSSPSSPVQSNDEGSNFPLVRSGEIIDDSMATESSGMFLSISNRPKGWSLGMEAPRDLEYLTALRCDEASEIKDPQYMDISTSTMMPLFDNNEACMELFHALVADGTLCHAHCRDTNLPGAWPAIPGKAQAGLAQLLVSQRAQMRRVQGKWTRFPPFHRGTVVLFRLPTPEELDLYTFFVDTRMEIPAFCTEGTFFVPSVVMVDGTVCTSKGMWISAMQLDTILVPPESGRSVLAAHFADSLLNKTKPPSFFAALVLRSEGWPTAGQSYEDDTLDAPFPSRDGYDQEALARWGLASVHAPDPAASMLAHQVRLTRSPPTPSGSPPPPSRPRLDDIRAIFDSDSD